MPQAIILHAVMCGSSSYHSEWDRGIHSENPFLKVMHIDKRCSRYVMSQNTWFWIMADCGLVYMWACASACAAVRAHTCGPRMPPCMIAFKHAFAFPREERSIPVGGWACEGVCILRSYCPHAHPQLHSASLLLTCAFPNSEISACSRTKSASITTDCLPS